MPLTHHVKSGESPDDDVLGSSDSEINNANDEMPPYGAYWSSNPRSTDSTGASYLFFSFFDTFFDKYYDRSAGLPVRPVTNSTTDIIQTGAYTNDSGKPSYTISGIRVGERSDAVKALPSGIYIKDGRKYIK